MYVVNRKKQVVWPVSVMMPIDGGSFEEQKFSVTFKRVSPQYQDDKLKELRGRGLSGLAESQAFFADTIVGWDGIADGEGRQPIPYSVEALAEQYASEDAVLFNNALWNAWNEIQVGGLRKN